MYFLDHYRTRISQVIGILFLFLFMFSQKELDVTAPYVGAAMAGRMWCAQYIAGYKNDVLVREGPYSVCRNPLYFFSFLGGIGVGLCTESLTLTAILVLLFAVMYIPVIHTEEVRLHRLFGEPYSAYIREVPRFFPKWSLYHEPKEYTVKPKVFRHAASDVLWFVLAVGILECIEAMQESGLLPQILSLY